MTTSHVSSGTTATASFRAARDQLLRTRTDIGVASEEFTWPQIGDRFSWARDWFDEMALDNHKLALWIVEEDGTEVRRSFDELRRRSNQVANWLASIGVRKGDHVLLMLDNQLPLWETMLAILKLGAVILPTSIVLGPHDLTERVERADVRVVIADRVDAKKFDEVPGDYLRVCTDGAPEGWHAYPDADAFGEEPVEVDIHTDDPAIVYFTSGTTSKPKMVRHTQASYPVGHLSTMYWLGVQPGDLHMAISSPGWGKHAWSSFFAPWIAEAAVFVYNYRRFVAEELIAQLDRAGVNTFCAPPTVWRMLIQHHLETKPSGLREILSAGEPLNPEVISTIERWWGLTIRDGYGQTETTAIVGNTPGQPVKAGSMGRPLPGVNIVLVDPITGEPAREGEICLDMHGERPLNLMAEYIGEPDRTARATRGGYFHTGDVAVRDEDGYITFIGRTDDVFKSSDYKVSPFEVESVLIEHEAVMEAAVVGAPDDVRLNITKAYVALAPGWEACEETAFQVLRHARENLPPYMRVRRVEFFDLPKTSSGKIRRVELRERELAHAGSRIDTEWRESDFPNLKRGHQA